MLGVNFARNISNIKRVIQTGMSLIHSEKLYQALRNHLNYALSDAQSRPNFATYQRIIGSFPKIRNSFLRPYLPQIGNLLPLFEHICSVVQQITSQNTEELPNRFRKTPRLPSYLNVRKQGRKRSAPKPAKRRTKKIR